MARPSSCSPLPCFVNRQIDDRIDFCKRLVDARLRLSENLFRKDLLSHYGCVNAIEFSSQGDLLVSGGDDRRVLLWKVEQAIQGVGKPSVMRAQHDSNIFCLGYNSQKSKIFSAGNDDQVIIHDLNTGGPLNFYLHEKPVYGLSNHPHNDNVFASACDDGRILIYDTRDGGSNEPFVLAQYKTAFHSVMHNPSNPRMLATANSNEGVSMWDVRKPLEPVMRYGTEGPARKCMYVRFNKDGNKLLALRRRLPPVLYSTDSPTHLCQFDHPGYYNSCTMKSCCFAGNDDEYVLSGSDDFKLYMWKIPTPDVKWVDSAHMILTSHRSIVNQVRYNPASCILASSGVEKMIKIWSPFPLGYGCLGGLKKDQGKQEKQRRIYTHDEYIRLVIHSGEFMSHDYSHESTREDSRMMAFFDSLVQREIQDWSSDNVSANPLSSSDSETQSPERPNVSDSDNDSTTSQQMVLNLLGSPAIPKRSKKSPNIINRLIASHRGKLMTLAAIESGTQVTSGEQSQEPTLSKFQLLTQSSSLVTSSSSESEQAAAQPCEQKHKSKNSKLKGSKRKRSEETKSRKRGKRKETSSSESSTDSEVEDAMQPSTSAGLSRHYLFAESSSESTVSEACSSGSQAKSNSRHRRKKRAKCKSKKEDKCNGKDSTTPAKRRKVAPTSDSGITSEMSTVEKNRPGTRRGESPEMEIARKKLLVKKIQLASKGYKKRSQATQSSDSSD